MMRAAQLFRQKRAEAEIWVSLAAAWILVEFVPFNWWRKTIGPIDGGGPDPRSVDQATLKRAFYVGLGVERVADRAWFAPVCLPRAIAARWILARRGIPSRIVFGSRRSEEAGGKLLFHAWLKVADIVVTGAQGHRGFVPFEKKSSGALPVGGLRPGGELPDGLSNRKT